VHTTRSRGRSDSDVCARRRMRTTRGDVGVRTVSLRACRRPDRCPTPCVTVSSGARTSSDGGGSRLRSSAAPPAAALPRRLRRRPGARPPPVACPSGRASAPPRAPWSPGSVRRSCGASTSPTNGTTSSWSCRRGRTHVGSPASGCAGCHWTQPTSGSPAGCAWCPRRRRRRGWQPCSIQTRRSWRSTAWSRLASSTWRRSAPAWPRRALHQLGCGGRAFERTGGRSRRKRRDCASWPTGPAGARRPVRRP
jgi:hypothetical protein